MGWRVVQRPTESCCCCSRSNLVRTRSSACVPSLSEGQRREARAYCRRRQLALIQEEQPSCPCLPCQAGAAKQQAGTSVSSRTKGSGPQASEMVDLVPAARPEGAFSREVEVADDHAGPDELSFRVDVRRVQLARTSHAFVRACPSSPSLNAHHHHVLFFFQDRRSPR